METAGPAQQNEGSKCLLDCNGRHVTATAAHGVMQAAMQAAKLFLPSNVNLRLAVAALTRTHTSPAPPTRAMKSDDKHVSDVLVAHEDVPQEAPTAYADCHTQSSMPHDGGWRTIGRGGVASARRREAYRCLVIGEEPDPR